MAIFIKDDIILPAKVRSYVQGLASFSDSKRAVSSEFGKGNKIAKIDRVTAQIRIFRTTKRDNLDRVYSATRVARVNREWFVYFTKSTINVYDLKVLLAICAVGEGPIANYLHSVSGPSDWEGLAREIQVGDILKFIDRRNDPENRERLFASLDRLCGVSVELKNYDPKLIDPQVDQFKARYEPCRSLIKIFERGGDEWINIGLCWTISKEAWIDNDNPKYAPVSMQEVHALSKNDIAMLLLVFFRSNLGVGAGAVYRYDDMVRLVRGEDGDLSKIDPTKGSTDSRHHRHTGADRQSVYRIKAALELIDARTNMEIYKDRNFRKFVVVRP